MEVKRFSKAFCDSGVALKAVALRVRVVFLFCSVNVHSFLQKGNKWPVWLNIAVGYGAENMFGGFENRWSEDGQNFIADNLIYPRYRQFYIGLDVDLPYIKPKNPFLKTIFSIINIFKIPSPALEINTQGNVVFHLLR